MNKLDIYYEFGSDKDKNGKDVTTKRLYIETMEEIFNSEEKPVLIDGQLDNVLPVKTLTGGAQ